MSNTTGQIKYGVLGWAAKTAWSARLPIALSLLVSFAIHSGFPAIWQADIKETEAVSVIEIIETASPDLPNLPEDKQFIDAPPEDTTGPLQEGPDDIPEVKAEKDPPPKEKPPEKKPPVDDKPPPLPKAHRGQRDNAIKTKSNEDLKRMVNRLKRQRYFEELRKRKGQRGKGKKPGGGSVPLVRTKVGKPGAVYLCLKDGIGPDMRVRRTRPVTEWVTVIPTVLLPFRTRPSLGSYLNRVHQVTYRNRKKYRSLGPVEFALPAGTIRMPLDAPGGVSMILGRPEGRCLVGLKYSRGLFPLTIRHAPVRFLYRSNRTVDAVVDVRLYKDGSFDVKSRDGTKLPFKSGKLKNSRAIRKTIEDHYSAARTLKDVAGWFGIDVQKMARESRRKRASERRKGKKKKKR